MPSLPENHSYWRLVTCLLFHLSPRDSVLNHLSPSSEIRNVSISRKKWEFLVAACNYKPSSALYRVTSKGNISFLVTTSQKCNICIQRTLNERMRWTGNLAQTTKWNVCCRLLFSMCAAQVLPNETILRLWYMHIIVVVHLPAISEYWKKGSITCSQVLNLTHNLYTLSFTELIHIWALTKSEIFSKPVLLVLFDIL